MSDNTNPQVNARRTAQQETQYSFLTQATVSSAESGQSGGNPTVTLQEAAVAADTSQVVLQPVHGDFYIPPAGLPVVSAPFTKNEYGVVSAFTPETTTPTLDPGERILSHPVSGANVRFNKNGTIDIAGDATVRINGGSQGIVTDATASTTKDGDGHVTSVSLNLTRDNNILI